MLAGGELVARGGGRSLQYGAHPISAALRTKPEHRREVPYRPALLDDYIPNVTSWLSESQIMAMEAAQPEITVGGSYPDAVSEKLILDLSYASSHMEGNTYSYVDTQVLLHYQQAADGKDARETAMILNHKEATSYLVAHLAKGDGEIGRRALCEVHALLAQGLLPEADVGTIRSREVKIGGSAYRPMAIRSQLEETLDRLTETANAITNPFEQSLFWMVQIAYLHPFADIDKRTGRIACNIPLLRSGKAPLSFMSMDKGEYIRGLLEFYEFGVTGRIAKAFTAGYTGSAHRYDAHIQQHLPSDKGEASAQLQ